MRRNKREGDHEPATEASLAKLDETLRYTELGWTYPVPRTHHAPSYNMKVQSSLMGKRSRRFVSWKSDRTVTDG